MSSPLRHCPPAGRLLVFLCMTCAALAARMAEVEPPPEPVQMDGAQRMAVIAEFEKTVAETPPLEVGATEAELLQRLGEPEGIMAAGPRKRLSYGDGYAIVADGRVAALSGIADEQLRAPNAEAYATYQQALGKVRYMGRWMTAQESKEAYWRTVQARQETQERVQQGQAEQAARARRIAREQAYPQERQGDTRDGAYRVIRRNGAMVSEQEILVPGMITVVDFFADWCGPCRSITPYLKQLAREPGIAVCKVDIDRWNSPVAQQWNLYSIPNMRVYDRYGRQIGQPTSDPNQLARNIERARSVP